MLTTGNEHLQQSAPSAVGAGSAGRRVANVPLILSDLDRGSRHAGITQSRIDGFGGQAQQALEIDAGSPRRLCRGAASNECDRRIGGSSGSSATQPTPAPRAHAASTITLLRTGTIPMS